MNFYCVQTKRQNTALAHSKEILSPNFYWSGPLNHGIAPIIRQK